MPKLHVRIPMLWAWTQERTRERAPQALNQGFNVRTLTTSFAQRQVLIYSHMFRRERYVSDIVFEAYVSWHMWDDIWDAVIAWLPAVLFGSSVRYARRLQTLIVW